MTVEMLTEMMTEYEKLHMMYDTLKDRHAKTKDAKNKLKTKN